MKMLTINLQNVEELIFYNKAVQQKLPCFYNTFQSWNLGKRLSALKHLCTKAIFDFFDQLNEEHIAQLEEHFDAIVKIVKTDPHLVKNFNFDLNCAECELNELDIYDNWFVWRNANELYISSWR